MSHFKNLIGIWDKTTHICEANLPELPFCPNKYSTSLLCGALAVTQLLAIYGQK